jgi:hypothetical protein
MESPSTYHTRIQAISHFHQLDLPSTVIESVHPMPLTNAEGVSSLRHDLSLPSQDCPTCTLISTPFLPSITPRWTTNCSCDFSHSGPLPPSLPRGVLRVNSYVIIIQLLCGGLCSAVSVVIPWNDLFKSTAMFEEFPWRIELVCGSSGLGGIAHIYCNRLVTDLFTFVAAWEKRVTESRVTCQAKSAFVSV